MRIVYLMTSNELAWGIGVIAILVFGLLFPTLSDAIIVGLIVLFVNSIVSIIYIKIIAGKIRTKQAAIISAIITIIISIIIIVVLNKGIRTTGDHMEYFGIVLIAGLLPMVPIAIMTPYPNPNIRINNPKNKNCHSDSLAKPAISVKPDSSQYLYCVQCGAPTTNLSIFCTQCGARLVD